MQDISNSTDVPKTPRGTTELVTFDKLSVPTTHLCIDEEVRIIVNPHVGEYTRSKQWSREAT